MDGVGLRTVTARAGVDRKTARRYVQAAQEAGLSRDAGPAALSDVIGVVVGAVRPSRPNGHGSAWETLLGHQDQIRTWGGRNSPYKAIVAFSDLDRDGRKVTEASYNGFPSKNIADRIQEDPGGSRRIRIGSWSAR